jgi:hypothetical protein
MMHVGMYRIQSNTLNNVPIANIIFYRTPTTWQDNNHSSNLLASPFPSASFQEKESKCLVLTDEFYRTSIFKIQNHYKFILIY